MIFYRIKFKSFPVIKFACTIKTDKYKNIISYRKNYIEISIGNNFEINDHGNIYTLPDDCFLLLMPDLDVKTNCIPGKTVYHDTVAIECEFEFERFNVDNPDELKQIVNDSNDMILLPFIMELGNEYPDLERLMKTLISYYLKETSSGKMQVLSLWFEIIAKIDEKFRRKVIGIQNENTGEYYSRKTKRYIENHYYEKITVEKIAELMNITPNYLSKIFKRETGKTITEVITRVRLNRARELVYEGKLNFDEIACKVGICNAKYMNQLFKKYYGVSVHKCYLIDHEISLYHDKPWDVENLKSDIYNENI